MVTWPQCSPLIGPHTVRNRKKRSIFSGAKGWFGGTKPPGSGGGNTVVYSREAPELQVINILSISSCFLNQTKS